MMVGSAHAVLQSPNSLLGGLTSYGLNDFENLYDSSGAIVSTRFAQAGDTLQGVFVITSVANAAGTAHYDPATAGNVQLTGIFDELVSGKDAAGNYILVPDTTTVLGSKPLSGSGYQSTYSGGSNNAMISVFYNNSNNMLQGTNTHGLSGLNLVQSISLATSGTLWATFGAKGTWGTSPTGYYWAANQTAPGVATFAASLGFITNATGIPTNLFLPITQPPPSGFSGTDAALFAIPNVFVIQGTTSSPSPTDSNANLFNTPYTIYSTDPARINLIPEPTSLLAMGGVFGLWALGLAAYRRFRKA
jgi:hypothetical protein